MACSPGITDLSSRRLAEQAEWDRVNTKIAQRWLSLGFRLYGDNVYLLSPASYDLLMAACREAGFEPVRGVPFTNVQDTMAEIGTGKLPGRCSIARPRRSSRFGGYPYRHSPDRW